MHIRLLSERGGHKVGAVVEVPEDDPAACGWIKNEDAERVAAPAAVQTSAQADAEKLAAQKAEAEKAEAEKLAADEAADTGGLETAMKPKAKGR